MISAVGAAFLPPAGRRMASAVQKWAHAMRPHTMRPTQCVPTQCAPRFALTQVAWSSSDIEEFDQCHKVGIESESA